MAMCEIQKPFWLWAFLHFLGVRMARIQHLATRSSTIEFLWRLAACAFGRETFCSETLTESARFQPKRRMKFSRKLSKRFAAKNWSARPSKKAAAPFLHSKSTESCRLVRCHRTFE